MRTIRKDRIKTSVTVGSVIWDICKWLTYVIMILAALSFVFIFIWLLLNALKTSSDYASNSFTLPAMWDWENFKLVIDQMTYRNHNIFQLLGNSLIYILITTVNAMIWPQFAGYACARFEFPGKKIIESAVYVAMVIPIIGATSSAMQIRMSLGLYDNWLGTFIFGSGGLGMGSVLYATLYRGMPSAFAEAAYIDGAGEWRVFASIYYPQSFPMMMIFIVQGVIAAWNDYMGPYMMLPSHPTIALGLQEMQARFVHFGGDQPIMFAGTVIVLVPVLVIYSIFADKIMGNTAFGSLK